MNRKLINYAKQFQKKWLDKNQTPIDTKQLVLMMKNEGTSLEEIIIILKKML